jgi:orsellinic acid C2-O-methyltransferase
MTPPDSTTDAMTIVEMVNASAMAQALYVAAKLGIADLLGDGSLTASDLARAAGADPDALHRLLRGLAAAGACEEQDDGRFALTAVGRHLRSDVEGSVRSYVLHWAGSMWPVWGRLLHTVKTGRNPRDLVTRKNPFESLAAHPEAERIFNDAMTEMSRLAADGVVRSCDFARFTRLVDVGGGHGELIGAILAATPALRGVLVDRPALLDGAREHLADVGVADRCEVVPGSFFEQLPAGADAYLLKSVLHDWTDDEARAILRNVREAMAPKGTLFIVERILPDRIAPSTANRFVAGSDLLMMVAASGRERTRGTYEALLGATGFSPARVVDTLAHYSVIEARRD